MSDEEHNFETADAGASHLVPCSAGDIRKGQHAMLKEKPCKVIDISTAKPGKHGSSKCSFTGTDIFTGKKVEDQYPSHAGMYQPIVTRVEFLVLDVNDDDDAISLLTDVGDTKDDLNLPASGANASEDDVACRQKIIDLHMEEKEFKVVVLCAMGMEKIIETKEMLN